MKVPSRSAERLNRILYMVPLALRGEGIEIDELCRRLEVSRKEVLADLQVLWMCGLPDYSPGDLIDFHIYEDRVYVDMADYFKRPMRITGDEAMVLMVAGLALTGSGLFERDGPVGRALDEVMAIMPEEDRREAERMANLIELELLPCPRSWWKEIEEALRDGKMLEILYYSFSRGEESWRRVEPLSLVAAAGHWYLLGWCYQAGDRRLFRLDRIRDLENPGEDITRKAEGLRLPAPVGEFESGKDAHLVRLRFPATEGRRLVEEWPNAKYREDRRGNLNITLRTRNLSWLADFLMRFGDRFSVLSPVALSELIRQKAEILGEAYEDDS